MPNNPFVVEGLEGTVGIGGSTDQTQEVITRNQVKLASSASSSDNAYNGLDVFILLLLLLFQSFKCPKNALKTVKT